MRTLLIVSFLFGVSLQAADFGGTWLGRIPIGFNGQHLRLSEQIAIKLIQNGTKLEGKLYGDYQSAPIIEGKVSGDEIDFVVIAQEQAGNQINESRLHFTGTLKDGELELSRVREGATNAGNSGTYQYKADRAKSTFRMKRLP
jgi:hypothetical protein